MSSGFHSVGIRNGGRGHTPGSWRGLPPDRGRTQPVGAGRGQQWRVVQNRSSTVNSRSVNAQECENNQRERGRPLRGRARGPFGINHKLWIKGLPVKDQEYLNAALSGDIAILQRIIHEEKVDLNVTDGFGHTALINAAWKDRIDVVKLLLTQGVSLNCRNHDGQTAMDKAAYWGFTEILRLLVAAGSIVDVRNNNGETPLQRAAMWGHVEAVNLLLDAKANGNEFKNQRRYTPLHFAAKHGKPDVVKALLRRKCDPSKRDCYGRTALELAKRSKKLEVSRLLEKWQREEMNRPKPRGIVLTSNTKVRACAWGIQKENSKYAICKEVCGYHLSAVSGEEGGELFLTLMGPENPSLTLSIETTSLDILGAETVQLFPPPPLTVGRQKGQNVGVKLSSPPSSSVLKFHRLAGLQVSPNTKPAYNPPPLLQLNEDEHQRGQKEDETSNCRYWMNSPHSYL